MKPQANHVFFAIALLFVAASLSACGQRTHLEHPKDEVIDSTSY